MRTKIILCSLFLSISLPVLALAQSSNGVPPGAFRLAPIDPSATVASLRTLRELGGQSGDRPSGIPLPAEVANTTVASPLPMYMVRLDHLKSYQPGTDPTSLLQNLGRLLYPVTVFDEPRSEIVMDRINGTWTAASLGGTGHAQSVEYMRRQVVEMARIEPRATFLVGIPGLYLEFIGHQGPDGVILTPTRDDQESGLKQGEGLSASAVFTRLAPLAAQGRGILR